MAPGGYSQIAIDISPKTGISNQLRAPKRGDLQVGQFLRETTRSWAIFPNIDPLVGRSAVRPSDGMQTRMVPYNATRYSCRIGPIGLVVSAQPTSA